MLGLPVWNIVLLKGHMNHPVDLGFYPAGVRGILKDFLEGVFVITFNWWRLCGQHVESSQVRLRWSKERPQEDGRVTFSLWWMRSLPPRRHQWRRRWGTTCRGRHSCRDGLWLEGPGAWSLSEWMGAQGRCPRVCAVTIGGKPPVRGYQQSVDLDTNTWRTQTAKRRVLQGCWEELVWAGGFSPCVPVPSSWRARRTPHSSPPSTPSLLPPQPSVTCAR